MAGKLGPRNANFHRFAWLCWLSLAAAVGCGTPPAAQQAPGVKATPWADDAEPPRAADAPAGPRDEEALADDDASPTGEGARYANPLLRGLGDLAGAVPLPDSGHQDLLESLTEADRVLSEIKDENRRALRDLNRQVQLPGSDQRSPNIVLVMADHLGPQQLGCYGGSTPTDRLDRLAAAGARLTGFYAGGAEPAASLWSLMTGRDTSQARDGQQLSFQLRDDVPTLAETMWQAGYQTAFVGHWQLPEEGRLRGFDDWLGGLASQGGPFPEYVFSRRAQVRLPKNAGQQRQQFADQLYTDEALAFLKRRDRRRPFLLVLCYTGPGAAQELGVDDITEQMVQRLDRDLARIDQQLAELRLQQQTAIFVTSNAPARGGDSTRRGAAGDLYEGGLRVPLIVRWPGRIRPGTVVDEPFGMWDLMPTFADMARAIRQPRGMDGVAMTAALRGRSPGSNRLLYWESRQGGFAQAVRMGDWKAVRPAHRSGRDGVELYNLADDPRETTNVARDFPQILDAFLVDG